MNQYLKKPLFYTTVFLFTLVIAAFVCVSVPQYAYADGEALDSSNQAAVTDQNVLADDLLENENNQESTTTGGGEESGIGSDTGDSSGENVAGDSSNVSNTQTTTDTQASDGIDTAVNASVNSIVSTTKTAMAKTSSKSGFVVAIDAGHGGSDSGAVANGLKEKDLTLKIALYARDYLLENFPGITVYMTRTTDVYLGLSERVANAVANGADLFFCIHINAGGGNGVEVWTLNDSSYRYDLYTESYKLSQAYLKQTDKLSLKNRGIKTRDSEHGVTYPDGSTADYLTVLYRSRLAGIPAVLTENLFIDNASNASYLSNEANLKKLGIANAKAIIEYLSASPHPSVSATANGQLTLSWTAVPGATKYAIARKTSSGYYTYTYNCTNTSYTITGLTNGSSYSFLVQAYVGGSWTKFTSNDLLTVKLVPSPSNVKATPSGDGVVTLTWNAVNGATKYAIAEKLSTGKYKNFSTTYTGTSFTVDNLSNGKSHRFLVQAYITGTWSPVSEDLLVSATPTGTMKPAPTVSSMTDTSVTLSWKAVPGATKYAIARKTSSGYSTYTYDCTDTKYTINNLKTASTYTFLVQAYIDGAWSKFTTSDLVSVVVTGSAPTNVKATASGDGEVTLTWNAVKGATKYAVAEKLSSGKYKTSSNAITSTTYTVSDLANGKTHQFLVQAYVNGTWSPASDFFLVSATPTGTVKPAVSAVPKVTSVELSWGSVPGATKYAVARKTSSGYYNYTLDCTDTTYTVTGLTPQTSYQFLVQAYIDGAWSKFTSSDLVTVKTTDTAPRNVKATATGDGQVTLTWDAVDGATKYAIAEKLSTGKYKNFSTTYTGTSYVVSNLSNGKSHRFLVQAYVNGTWSSASDTLLVSATPTGTVKPAVSAVPKATSVELSWGSVPGATKYAVARKTSSGYYNYTLDCTDTTYTVTGLTPQTSYQFLVQAYIDGAWSKFTSSDLVSTKTTNDIAPRNVKATATGDGQVTLTWDAVDGATKYAIAEKLSTGKYKNFSTTYTGTSYVVSNLSNGKSHQFLVQAYVNGTWSPASDTLLVSATPTGTIKPSPKATTHSDDASVAHHNVKLSWKAVPGATKYVIARKTSSGYYNYTLDCTNTSYTVTGLNGNTTYQFLVQAYIDGAWSKFTSSDLVSATPTGANVNIMGTTSSSTTAAKLAQIYNNTGNTYPASTYKSKGAPTITKFCQILIDQANSEGVRAEVLFSQVMLETGWLQFGGDVQPSQCNFGGLGATGNGVHGETFKDVATGLLAQTQHLKAYASTEPLRQDCVDSRFAYVKRGIAPTVFGLTGTWAASSTYGTQLAHDFLDKYFMNA